MRTRRRSLLARAGDIFHVFAVAGIGVVVVFVVMNILVTWAPIGVASPSPSVTPAPSFPATLSAPPFAADSPFVTPAPTASLPATKPVLIRSAVSVADPKGNWSVYLEYPTFQSGTTPWADSIDAEMTDEVQTRASQWEVGPAADRRQGARMNKLTGSFTTETLTPALASFTLTWKDDISAAPPPGLDVETVTYDLGTGQRLVFSDVFPDITSALATISVKARSLLQDQLGSGFDPAVAIDGTNPSPLNYSNWAVTKDGIRFTFSQYQVTARADLQPTVVVPWETIRPVMARTGPVATIAGLQS
jgi:hypothetical protein